MPIDQITWALRTSMRKIHLGIDEQTLGVRGTCAQGYLAGYPQIDVVGTNDHMLRGVLEPVNSGSPLPSIWMLYPIRRPPQKHPE